MAQATKTYAKLKRKGLFAGILGVVLSIAGVLTLILPAALLTGGLSEKLLYIILGAAVLVIGFYFLISGMTEFFARPYALVFTENGLVDFTGKHKNGMFVEWNNVKDAHVYGKGDAAFIGIELISLEIAYKNISASQKREMCENVSNGMPHIIIPQSEIAEPIGGIVKAILQTRLGTKADMFKNESLENAVNNIPAPRFTAEELKELDETGDVDFASDVQPDKHIDKIQNSEKEERKTLTKLSKTTQIPKEPLPEATEKDIDAIQDMPETASIDDLLAMLSIGEDK